MTTVLQYLVIAAVIGCVVFAIAVVVFGRGEQLAPLPPRTSPTELPDTDMTGDDIRSVRFPLALRGYRMSDVDWALERMSGELDRLHTQLAELSSASETTDRGVPAGARHSAPTDATSDGDHQYGHHQSGHHQSGHHQATDEH